MFEAIVAAKLIAFFFFCPDTFSMDGVPQAFLEVTTPEVVVVVRECHSMERRRQGL